MSKFVKKPVEIEAVQLTWANWGEICDFVSNGYFVCGWYVNPMTLEKYENPEKDTVLGLEIKTLEGNHIAVENDWVIKEIKGEFYPCKPDIFEATYSPVEENQ